jgi:hypothetical protein
LEKFSTKLLANFFADLFRIMTTTIVVDVKTKFWQTYC